MARMIHWVAVTADEKVGPVPVSYSPKETCPDTCSLKGGGCYAWGLFYLNILGKKVASGKLATSLTDALKNRAAVARIVRHRVAGDSVGDVPGTIEECKEVEAAGLINVGYTHSWREEPSQPLKQYFRASCESVEEVMQARSNGWGATIIIDKDTSEEDIPYNLPNGERAYLCPTQVEGNKGKISCNTCTLCKITPATIRKTVIFKTHGSAATERKAKAAIGAKV
jgi:hypothetical protein